MQYFALLISQERERTPEEGAEGMAAFQAFHAKAASAIRAGDALAPTASAVRITGGPDAPVVTDGPFAESAEVACGYYVFEAENLDEALALARDIPVAEFGAVEVRPTFHAFDPDWRCCSSHRHPPLFPARRSGRRKRNGTVNSQPLQAITSSAGPRYRRRRRRRRCEFATVRCC
jgi:hypothetical protein